jgi:hypothetical protein
MKQYILLTTILFLVLQSTAFALEQKPAKPVGSESRIQLNEDTGQWKIVDPKSAGQADELPSFITRPTCSVPPIKDLLTAPRLVDKWIDNGCINPAELEKVIVPIVQAIPEKRVKDNINGYDLLSRLDASNSQYREKKKFYKKRALEVQPKVGAKPIKKAESIVRKKAICTQNVDDNGLIEEILDNYFPVDRFGPKPHSLNDWCYDKDNKELSIVINHKRESEAIAVDLAKRIGQEMIMTSRTMRQADQLMSPFQEDILSKGVTVVITWPGRKNPAAWSYSK